ncbi:MAG: hypothetical protein BGP23_11970 [Lysobacterales bacterium 66-474]|nr:MAG: hypothetical protein ABT18_03835 [Rhodanobacter sp. SCN 66-43]OJY86885.1 MAG: hypothetical protein BGP23_11970 [Xanthomonadales bacterium 66-474]
MGRFSWPSKPKLLQRSLRAASDRARLRRMLRLIALALVAGTLAACSPHTTPATTAAAGSTAPAPATTNALAGTPLSGYGHDLNKARNVQNIVNDQAKKQAAAIDAATGSSG